MEDAQGLIRPPHRIEEDNIAAWTAAAFADFEAEFEFRTEQIHTDAGFLFRAQDRNHYYLVEFPCSGQQYRTEYFWACISKVDESGWTKVLRMQTVHGVPTEIGTWHRCKVVADGNELRVWVDGRPLAVVCDDTYPDPGYVGFYSYNSRKNLTACSFRNLRIRGRTAQTLPWDKSVEPVQNWFYPTLDQTYGGVIHTSNMTRAPNGELLMKLAVGSEFHGEEFTPVLIRSGDNGRTWSAQERLPDSYAAWTLHTTRAGRLLLANMSHLPPFSMRMMTSDDNGRTWSKFQLCGDVEMPEHIDKCYGGTLHELRDGTLLWFLYTEMKLRGSLVSPDPPLPLACVNRALRASESGGTRYFSHNYCIRSTDGGRNWSAPVSMDGPAPSGFDNQGMALKHFGSEVSAAETRDGRIMALVRGFFEPVMWETWSADGGKNWTPATRGPFPMWKAGNCMLCTGSGALVMIGGFPGVALQLSYDDGMTWQCCRIDNGHWANGFIYEVEPDVVLYATTPGYADPRTRIHLIRITPEGPEPVRI